MMNKKYTPILLMCLLTLSAFSPNKISESETIIRTKLIKKAKETSSIISPFTQEKYLSYMKEPQHSSGIFY